MTGYNSCCPKCNNDVSWHLTLCPVCYTHVGFPNVRVAKIEKDILDKRYVDARSHASRNDCIKLLDDFGDVVKQSKAVIGLNLGTLHELVSKDANMKASFYKQIISGVRLPEDNEWDTVRASVDEALFPLYKDDINFAALTLDNRGVEQFGPYFLVLKTDMIYERSTVFENNAIVFCRDELKMTVGTKFPPGYRAIWNDRNILAVAKLYQRIDMSTATSDYAKILLTPHSCVEKVSFIEVHIYGTIHRRAIERVVGPKIRNKEDLPLWESIKTALAEIDVAWEER